MRRRQQQQQVNPSKDQLYTDKSDPESLSNSTFPQVIMIDSPMKKMEVEIQSGDAETKPFTLLPRNYKQRRQLAVGTCLLFFFLLFISHSKGKTNEGILQINSRR